MAPPAVPVNASQSVTLEYRLPAIASQASSAAKWGLAAPIIDGYSTGQPLTDGTPVPAVPHAWAAGFCLPPGHPAHDDKCITTSNATVTDVAKNTLLVAAIDSVTCGGSGNPGSDDGEIDCCAHPASSSTSRKR